MGEVPIKYVFHGDREAGKGYMRRGAVMMDMLEHAMSYQGLRQGVMRRRPIRGVLIECDHRFGLRTVTITVAPQTPEEIVVVEDRELHGVVVAVSCSSGLFLHNGNWKGGKPFSEGRHQYAHYAPVPDGWVFTTTTPVMVHSQLSSWAYAVGAPRALTRPAKIRPSFFDLFIRISGYGYDREDSRLAWYTPAVMPGFTGKDYILSHNLMYRQDDPRIEAYNDLLLASELTLQEWKHDGRQEPTTKWVYSSRGIMSNIDNGQVFDIVALPERDTLRGFVALPGGTHVLGAWTWVLFSFFTLRSGKDLRRFDFTPEMLLASGVFPAELDWGNRERGISQAHAYMDDTGVTHICFVLSTGDKNGTGYMDNVDAASITWAVAVIFVTIPALSAAMTAEEEQEAILAGITVKALTWDTFLPLLDQLQNLVGTVPGGRYDVDGSNSLLTAYDYWHVEDGYWYDLRSITKPQYTIDGTVYHAGRMPYDITACRKFDRWGHNNDGWRGIIVRDRDAQYVLSYALGMRMPADNVVFHSGTPEQWYSWTRMWGGLSITPGGLSRADMTMPAETATDGVRPEITWAGDGLYCCVCLDTSARLVRAVYIGTPFDSAERPAWWHRIPLVTDEWAARAGHGILLIRPALVTPTRVVLLAIVREGARCRAAYCDGPPDSALLRFCGEIPLDREDEDGMTLDICDHGEGDIAEMLRVYPDPPRSTGAVPYSNIYKYADSRGRVHSTFPHPEFQEEWHDISEYD